MRQTQKVFKTSFNHLYSASLPNRCKEASIKSNFHNWRWAFHLGKRLLLLSFRITGLLLDPGLIHLWFPKANMPGVIIKHLLGLPWRLRRWRIYLQCRRPGFDPWFGKNPLEKDMATHSSILAWRIPWTEEPGGLQSMRSQSWTWLATCTWVNEWILGQEMTRYLTIWLDAKWHFVFTEIVKTLCGVGRY